MLRRSAIEESRMTRQSEWGLPFDREEYLSRLERTRVEMARREVDLLYVTSPDNLYYLLGHESVWWDGRNVTGLAVPLDAGVTPIMFDTWDHAPAWSPVVADGVTYGERGFYYPEGPRVVADTLRDRGLLKGRVGLEEWSWAPAGPALRELSCRLTDDGAGAVVDGSWIVDHVRLVKSPREIEYTRKALKIADAAYEALAAALTPGMTEKDIMGLLYHECARRGGDEPGIRMMVRTGPNTVNFHHPATDRRIRNGELLMIDMCAAYNHYHGNTARTIALGEQPFWKEKLEKLARVRDDTVAALRPGDQTQHLQELMDAAVDEAGGLREHVWWVGGYALGATMPPDWAGHVYLSDDEGFEAGVFEPGFVANWEVQLWDVSRKEGVGVIDTMITTERGVEVPAEFPATLTVL
jgi:Xaa-Pro dipeptidase